MVENKSSLFGIIAIIIGASGLGLGVFSVVNFQTIEGIPGDDGQEGIDGDDGQDGIDGDDAPGGIIVGILDPDEGETISGNVTIRAMIAGSEAYTVSILRNGTEIGTTLPMKWNTTLVPDGWWNITVIVMDVLTQDQSSDHLLVYVDNNPTMTRVYLQGNMEDLSAGYYFLDFDATSYDPENCFNLITDRYYVPKDGYYLIICQITTYLFDGEYIILQILNSTGSRYGYCVASGHPPPSIYTIVYSSDIRYLQQGDYLFVLIELVFPSGTRGIYGGEAITFFSIMCVS